MEHPLLLTYGPFQGWHLLLILGTISIGFFLYQVTKATRLVLIGSSDSRFDSWIIRIYEFIIGWLGQKKVLRDRIAGTLHVLMLPFVLVIFLAIHFWRVRKDGGISGPL